MPDDLPFVPDATLDLVDHRWWLDLRCGCGPLHQHPAQAADEAARRADAGA